MTTRSPKISFLKSQNPTFPEAADFAPMGGVQGVLDAPS